MVSSPSALKPPEPAGYRPEIDGLRALAILAVVLFHADLGLTGGFVGVDVFFVLSGYLITSLILKDLSRGTFSFWTFYERRARRIVPALVVVVLATLVAGWWLLLPEDYAALGVSAWMQSLGVANLHFWRATGYFLGAATEKPLLHTWSLAVEEQFYVVAPILLWLGFGSAAAPRTRRLGWWMGLSLVGSFALALAGMPRAPGATFYLMPTRAWELLIGSCLAWWPRLGAGAGRPLREVAAWLGLALIVIPLWTYSSQTPFPGLTALPPCLGTGLVLWANTPDGIPSPRTSVARGLQWTPLRFIGWISYSFYLWHWPFFAYSHYLATGPLSLSLRLGLVALSFGLAVLSWRWVETPFRERAWCAPRPRMLAAAAAGLAVCWAAGWVLSALQGAPARMPPAYAVYFPGKEDLSAFQREVTPDDVRAGRLASFGRAGNPADGAALLVWGDSFAMSALPALDALGRARGIAVRAATHSSTAPVLGYAHMNSVYGLREKSADFARAVLDLAGGEGFRDVMLIANWSMYDPAGLRPALLATVRHLREKGCRVRVVQQWPSVRCSVPRIFARVLLFGESEESFRPGPEDVQKQGLDSVFLGELTAAGADVLDPRPAFWDEARPGYRITHGGRALYRDHAHLTRHGAEAVLLPWLELHFPPQPTPR